MQRYSVYGLIILVSILSTACQPTPPPGPTPIPSATLAPTASPSPTSLNSPTSMPPLRPMLSATPPSLPTQEIQAIVPTETPGPYCFIIGKDGGTLTELIIKAGYTSMDVLEEVRRLNNLVDNTVNDGQRICIPRQTPTPSPAGYEMTQTAQSQYVEQTGPMIPATYVIKEGENIMTIQLNSGVPLRVLCQLNHPDRLNCGGCDLTAKIGNQGCRPIVVAGASLVIPGPTPTPSVTPTLTGSETPTLTPNFGYPVLLSPMQDELVRGPANLVWMPVGVLQQDQYYLVIWTDSLTGMTLQHRTQATTVRLPDEFRPKDGQPHVVNWQIAVATQAQDGSDILITPFSPIYSFSWAQNQ